MSRDVTCHISLVYITTASFSLLLLNPASS